MHVSKQVHQCIIIRRQPNIWLFKSHTLYSQQMVANFRRFPLLTWKKNDMLRNVEWTKYQISKNFNQKTFTTSNILYVIMVLYNTYNTLCAFNNVNEIVQEGKLACPGKLTL